MASTIRLSVTTESVRQTVEYDVTAADFLPLTNPDRSHASLTAETRAYLHRRLDALLDSYGEA